MISEYLTRWNMPSAIAKADLKAYNRVKTIGLYADESKNITRFNMSKARYFWMDRAFKLDKVPPCHKEMTKYFRTKTPQFDPEGFLIQNGVRICVRRGLKY